MNRNAFIFIMASLAVLFGWNLVVDKLYPPKAPAAFGAKPTAKPGDASAAKPAVEASQAPVKPAASATASALAAGPSLKAAPEKVVAVETGAYQAVLSSWGARLTQLRLKGVVVKEKEGIKPMDLVPVEDLPRYATVQLPGVDLAQLTWALLTPKPVDEGGRLLVRFATKVPGSPLELVKAFSFDPEKAEFEVQVAVRNAGVQRLNLAPLALEWGPNIGGESGGMGMFPPAGVVQLEGKIVREKADGDEGVLSWQAPRWVALRNHYFVAGFFPAPGSPWTRAEVRRQGKGKMVTALVAEGLSLEPGQTAALKAAVYAGPQDFMSLKAYGNNFQRVVQFQYWSLFDWLDPLSVGLLYLMRWFQWVTGNWGVAIVLLTLLVRGLLFWPSLKSMVSMRRMQVKMAAMQPRLETIKKIYKDDPNRLNQETMKLYKEFGVNPLGGCLPMLLQIPIFFALYGTLSAAFELRQAHFFWKWTDLTAGDPTYLFPLAMGASMWLQQKLAPTNTATMSDEQAQIQKMMLWMFPIMFTGMAVFMAWPVGLLLYWTASNVFGIIQQLAVNKTVTD